MPNHSLEPLTPLGDSHPQTVAIGTVSIQEVVNYSLASIAQRHDQKAAFNNAADQAFGMTLPTPGRANYSDSKTLMWTGADQWFFEAPSTTHEDIANILTAVFKETASITEQTGGWCRFDLVSDESVALLQRLCELDVAIMATNEASRSVVEHIGVFIICREHCRRFSIYGPRSFAGSLHHALTTAAKGIVGFDFQR